VQLHIGFDDTDSASGGCTTYIAAKLVEKLAGKTKLRFSDYPNIIRLNPNIPYKTRGNAAVALRVTLPEENYESLRDLILDTVEKESSIGHQGTDPAVVFLKENPPLSVTGLARRALCEIVPVTHALRTIRNCDAEAASYGSDIGLVGAVAAIGNTLREDHTFELIAYRNRRYCGTHRRIDVDSIKRMSSLTSPLTFNNYDSANRRALITPHGPDPVLLGIRGETPNSVRRAFHLLVVHEPIERWVIFRTNHGTDAHLRTRRGRVVSRNTPVALNGIVSEYPRRILGGHVLFPLRTEQGLFMCAAFEPTGDFRNVAGQLIPGDEVRVFGGVPGKHGLTINLERLLINRLVDHVILQNPFCPNCAKRLKSAGSGKGFKCTQCSAVFHNASKIRMLKKRKLKSGMYLPSPKAHRHLTKPLSRYGREKLWNQRPPSAQWHFP
jgi:tRNA(Ile2)-agmatinylcytidine synthase